MNKLVGIQALANVINVLVYFSKSLTNIFSSKNIIQETIIIIYMTTSVLFLLLAANGFVKLNKIGNYLFEHRNDKRMNTFDISNILLLKEDMASNPLGLKAYEFVINFGFLINIFSAVLTYSIVLLQFKNATQQTN